MTEHHVGELLLNFAFLFALTYLAAGLLERVRIPGILGALLVAMIVHYTPIGQHLLTPEMQVPLSLLAELGVLFLLFFIGLQIDPGEMRGLSGDIIWLTILNTVFPFLLGVIVMLTLGYSWILAFIIGLTRMPTAEAVIVPILDEFKLIRTRVGSFIIGAGVLDDVIEVILIAIVSVWIGKRTGDATGSLAGIIAGLILFLLISFIGYRWLIPLLARWLPRRPRNLMFLSMVILLALGGMSEYTGLGMVVGAVIAGVLMRPAFNSMGETGSRVTQTIQSVSYGFLGLFFFLWVGLSVDLGGIADNPKLTILLYLAGTLGKLIGVFIMVPMKRMNFREALVVGVGLDARLTTEIIVAKLLLDASIIDVGLFTALVAAASFTAVTVPFAFALLVRKWGEELRA